ncbi:hypothetical protein BC827DRAFT_504626 [Russula dissimulans]|nr:hypothetical protein BC827DRAFT_504626 [Russula dissimulans]
MDQYNRQRIVTVCFTPQQEGFYEATLELTLCNHRHKADFVIKRTLSGRAEHCTDGDDDGQQQTERALSSSSQSINDRTDDHATTFTDNEEYLDSDGTGISVSHEDGLLDFGIVELKRPKGLFATPSASLTIQLADGFPAVTLIEERFRSSDGSNLDFVAIFEGDSRHIRPGTESTVLIIFSPKFEGVYKATLELVFYHRRRSARFVVRRELQGIARSLGDDTQFIPFNKVDGTILLLSPDYRRRLKIFPEYGVPPIIRDAVDKSSDTRPYDKNASDLVFALRPDHLNMNTYAHYFKALLNIEDGHREYGPYYQSLSFVWY